MERIFLCYGGEVTRHNDKTVMTMVTMVMMVMMMMMMMMITTVMTMMAGGLNPGRQGQYLRV